MRAATLALFTLAACAGAPTQPTRHLTFLSLNDVYELGAADGKGGFARLKTMVDGVRRQNPHAVLTVSGDFVSPSMMSS
ncbi:MAG: bifunctional metallophosphatase/5'-nucleotidase, partial [Nitrospinae bacterium]|nr:bifunctional metallophosphatase/5'-nucleotidase [Nitrospinota bacterium]